MKIFALLSRVPYPLDKGDKLRAYHQLRVLSQHHQIYLCCIDDDNSSADSIDHLKEFCHSVHVIPLSKAGILFNIALAFLKGQPIQCGYFYSRKAQKEIDTLITKIKPDHIYCQLVRVTNYVSETKIPKTLDYQDVFSMGMKRRITAANFFLRPFFWMEYRRLARYEKIVFDQFDNKTIITAADREFIPHPGKDQIAIISNGVDFDKFYPILEEKTYDLVFTGNMAYPPNIDAAVFLAREIMPEIWKTKINSTLLIAGATPDRTVKELAQEKITVTGWVPDMPKAYASAKVFIAPMRLGTGLQNKLLEAMAMKTPCITSPLAFEAIGATAGQEIMVAGNAKEFAAAAISLLHNDEKAIAIAEAGYIFVQRNYDWQSSTAVLEKIMLNTTH